MKAARRVLIDTNVLIYATLEDDPRFPVSREQLLSTGKVERFVSVQNLAEMYPNLTGPRMERPDEPAAARAKIQSIASLPSIQVLPLTGDVQALALELCEKHGITRQRYYDAQLVATMQAHGIDTLITENARDFDCFTGIRTIDPFRPARKATDAPGSTAPVSGEANPEG
jgi:predicted nucleic acid-binding protein